MKYYIKDLKAEKYIEINNVKKLASHFGENLFTTFEALKHNDSFNVFISLTRKSFDIPIDGFDINNEDIFLEKNKIRKLENVCKQKSISSGLSKYDNDFNTMQEVLLEIILYGGILLGADYDPFLISNDYINGQEDGLNIFTLSINQKVSKHALINYINNNWDEISHLMSELGEKSSLTFHEKGLEIYRLYRTGKYTYNDIADKLNKKNGKYVYKYNQDQVKRIYHLTLAKINSVFR